MNTQHEFEKRLREAQDHISAVMRLAVRGFTSGILKRLEALGLRHQDLADRLNVSRPYISHLVSGKSNYTLETMVKVAYELGCDLTIRLEEREGQSTGGNYAAVGVVMSSKTIPAGKQGESQDIWCDPAHRGSDDTRRGPSLVCFSRWSREQTGEGLALFGAGSLN